MKFLAFSSLLLALGASAAPQDLNPTRDDGSTPPPLPAIDPAPEPPTPAIDPAPFVPVATITATAVAVNMVGCSGLADRALVTVAQTGHEYQLFCFSQPAGFAAIPGALSAAEGAGDCTVACESWNAQPVKNFICHAALFTAPDKKCQLLWQADGNVVPRSDSHYVVAHNF